MNFPSRNLETRMTSARNVAFGFALICVVAAACSDGPSTGREGGAHPADDANATGGSGGTGGSGTGGTGATGGGTGATGGSGTSTDASSNPDARTNDASSRVDS